MDVRAISEAEHLARLSESDASFMQYPSWGRVKAGWTAESLGWFGKSDDLPGVALVLYRKVPGVNRYLAYLPEGPVIDWGDFDLERWLAPLVRHLRSRGVFTVKIGPRQALHRWSSGTVRNGAADPHVNRLGDMAPDCVEGESVLIAKRLRALGWRRNESQGGNFGDYQPRHVFELPLAGRDATEIRASFSSAWRRNLGKAERSGVEVECGGYGDLATFHALLDVTGDRAGFSARPLGYLQRQYKELTAEDPRRMRLYLARYEGEVVAGATLLSTGRRTWFQSGGSSERGRDARPSNALQWRMIRDSLASGAAVYDMRGISDTLDPTEKLYGLTRFKLGSRGWAVETLGEWDLPINRLWHHAVSYYLSRR